MISLSFQDELDTAVCIQHREATEKELKQSIQSRLHKLSKKPLSFWFLNHHLEKDELARQIGEMKGKGFGGFFLHPRGGLHEPYGSLRWFELIGFCLAEARKSGLEAWLYDEDPYPSGAAGGRVTLQNPEYRASCLKPTLLQVDTPGWVILDLEPGALEAAYLIQGEKIERIDDHVGLVRSDWVQFHSTAGYYPPYHIQGAPHWRAESVAPHYRASFEVKSAPAVIVGFVRQFIKQNPWGDYPDLLNLDAVKSFIESTHRQYAKHFSSEFGGVVPGIFTDESKLRGDLPWSKTLGGFFFRLSGLILEDVLPHLVLDINDQTVYIRWAYREALAQGFLNIFIGSLGDASASLDLLWTGHLSPEEDPIGQVIYVPGLMRALAKMDIPGTDLIGAKIGDAQHPLLHLSPKLVSSAAHGAGKPFVACEAFAVTDWVQDFSFLTKTVYWLYALGVNRIVTHGQYYSIDGLRKREAPPSQFFQASHWEHFGAFSNLIESLSNHLVEGVHEAPVLLYYPEESFMALSFGGKDTANSVEARRLRQSLGDLVHQLLVSGYDFDLADAALLKSATFSKGKIVLGEESYHTVVVPGLHLCESSWRALERFQQAGISVYFMEPEILILDKIPRRVEVMWHDWTSLKQHLNNSVPPLWACAGELIGHKRRTKDGPLLFLCNNGKADFSGRIVVDFSGPYEVCDPEVGTWNFTGAELRLELSAGLGLLIRRAQNQNVRRYILSHDWQAIDARWSSWQAEPLTDNCLIISEFRYLSKAEGTGLLSLPDESQFSTAPMIDLLSPSCLHVPFPLEVGARFLFASFDWDGPLTSLRLVCDTELEQADETGANPEKMIFVNQTRIPKFQRRMTYDPMNEESRIDSLIHEGRNTLLWVQKGRPNLPWPNDAIRLFGKFHAEFPYGRPVPARLSRRPEKYDCCMPTPPGQVGHAHYGGIVQYRASFLMASIPERLVLRFGRVYESMEIVLNGQSLGCLWKAPYLMEVDPRLILPGDNELLLRCSTSPSNYLQAMQRPAGTFGPIEWCKPSCYSVSQK